MIRYINKAVGREILTKKKTFIYFGGTSYLSLQTHFRFKRWLLKGVLKYGAHHGASRNSNIRISLFGKAEKILAKQAGAPAAIAVSSGYLAGQLVAKQFLSPAFQCLYLPHTHTALKIDPRVLETDYNTLEAQINKVLSLKKTPVVFLDSIDFFGKHFPEFTSLKSLDLSQCILVADDSHGLGITENEGGGSYSILNTMNAKELLVTASLGKGLGISGGVVFCDILRATTLKKSPTFGGASPAALAGLYAYNEAPEIYKKQLIKLHKNVNRFEKGVKKIDFFYHHLGHPAFSFQSPKISKGLEDAGFIITHFPYPTERDPMMSRIVITAGHKKKDIELLCKAVNTLLDI
jgi:8-amino-7-oxononanoate synthase